MCELPVVATDIGGLPETISDGLTGFIVKATDVAGITEKVTLLLSDKELGIEMGRAARFRQQSEYNYEKYREKLDALYVNLITSQ
jgi:colanic acid/amylovoran biosynthesis glycosyltransferase